MVVLEIVEVSQRISTQYGGMEEGEGEFYGTPEEWNVNLKFRFVPLKELIMTYGARKALDHCVGGLPASRVVQKEHRRAWS